MSADPSATSGTLIPGRFPVVRVRHPCRDAAELRARFAEAIATKGIFIPSVRPRPVGAQVELVLELRDGSIVRGVALAVAAGDEGAGRQGVTLRFVRLLEGSLEYDPAPAASPPAPAPAPAPARGQAPVADRSGPPASRDALDDAAVVDEAAAGEADGTIDVPLRADVLETRIAADEAERLRRQGLRRRRARLGAVAAVAAALVAAAAFLAGDRRTQREIDARVSAADARLADGRLTGGDAALDHLVAARALRPDDAGVRERLHLLADKLEELGETAIRRGDYAEAAVHLTAASQAEPERHSVHLRLGEIARGRTPPRADAGGGAR